MCIRDSSKPANRKFVVGEAGPEGWVRVENDGRLCFEGKIETDKDYYVIYNKNSDVRCV